MIEITIAIPLQTKNDRKNVRDRNRDPFTNCERRS